MTLLNQIIAVLKGSKARTNREISDTYKLLQKPDLFKGLSKTYAALDEEGVQLPAEGTLVQLKANDILNATATTLSSFFDLAYTQEFANTQARADIVIDGKPLLRDVPVTYLLFLEKQLNDLATFIGKFPTLDPSEAWEYDANAGYFKTAENRTKSTKKVRRAFVLYEATKEHPAKVDSYDEDVIVGFWTTVKFSGALPADRLATLLGRVEQLQDAVKFAREQANSAVVADMHVAKPVFDYLLK